MPQLRHLCQFIVCATMAIPFAAAHSGLPTDLPTLPEPIRPEMSPVESPYLDQLWSLPILRFFSPSFAPVPEWNPSDADDLASVENFDGCPIQSLQEMEDSQALAFENRVGGLGAVDLDGPTPSTAMALARFQRMVTAAGGAIAVTSAYRPATYQEHLRNVWEKWMGELRFNRDPLCQELRWQVQDEFQRHALLESQRPVVDSDHTRGLSFDAAVRLPGRKKGRRGRVSVDLLARRAGVLRPDIRRDPVHFKLMM